MSESTFNVMMTSGDIFQYSVRSSKLYVEMWDTKVDRTYDWKWTDYSVTAWNNWGGSSCVAIPVKSFSFNSSTGKFSYTTGETKMLKDLQAGEVLKDNRNISSNSIIRVEKVTDVGTGVTVSVFYPVVSVKSEQKMKGDNIMGVQFAINESNLLSQGVNEYMKTEYYCEKKK